MEDKNGRCATCKHWKRYTDPMMKKSYGKHAGECKSLSFVEATYTNRTPVDGLMYWDKECYSAGFNTGEAFGCVQWASKEK